MMNLLKATAAGTVAKITGDEEPLLIEDDGQILPICPYHDQIRAFYGFRDTWISQHGLKDFEEAVLRKEIIDKHKAVGIEEMVYREDMHMFFTGAGRLVRVAVDAWELFKLIKSSDNWSIEFSRMSTIEPAAEMMHVMAAYGTFTNLWSQGLAQEAGEAAAMALFPKKLPVVGDVEWPALPYRPPHENEVIAGTVYGLIYTFTGQDNQDNIAACIEDGKDFEAQLDSSVSKIYKRWNDDVVEGIAELRATLTGMGSFFDGCSDTTKEQVKMINERLGDSLEEATILDNLQEHMKHVELKMQTMKMDTLSHDYMGYGTSMGDVFLTLIAQ